VIAVIKEIYKYAESSQLRENKLELIAEPLIRLTEYLSVSKTQALFFAYAFRNSCRARSTAPFEIMQYLNLDEIETLLYAKEFEDMVKKGIFFRSCDRSKNKSSIISDNFIVNPNILKSIADNAPIQNLENFEYKNNLQFLEAIGEMNSEETDSYQKIERSDIQLIVRNLLENNKKLSLIKRFKAFELSDIEIFLLSTAIWQNLNGINSTSLSNIVESYYPQKRERVTFIQKMLNGNSLLIQKDLCKIEQEGFFNSVDVLLSDKMISLLAEDEIIIRLDQKPTPKLFDVIMPENIDKVDLVYNENVNIQVNRISNLLKEKNYQRVKSNLGETSKGISIMLYGAAGTGKTELVYQLAKESERIIFPIRIEALKSKWYGQSERLIAGAFNEYEQLSKQSKLAPILLLNEAEKLINNRSYGISNSVNQTENTIQAILKEKLETFRGILIATVNDPNQIAVEFNRRFLYKLNITLGNTTTRAKLWNMHLPELHEELVSCLSNFELSPASIVNIIRKFRFDIALGENVTFKDLPGYCHQEADVFGFIKRKPMGF
jgi:SpoVK/Ycf46/Vps4 family AAA+-type ATPase